MEFSDVDLFQQLVPDGMNPDEQVGVVSDASYFSKQYGPFLMSASDVADFVKSHHGACGECFFDGDVIFLRPSVRQICLFHHEGLFLILDLESSNDSR